MYEIEFRKEGIIVRKVIKDELLGEKTLEEKYTYEELSKMEGLELKVRMPIKPVIKDGILVAIVMDVAGFTKAESEDIGIQQDKASGSSEIPKHVEKRLKMGDIPEYIVQYTRRRYKKGTQEHTIAEIIKQKGVISDRELKEVLKKKGYSGKGGSLGAAIKVLKDITKEIKVEGRGGDKTYIWVGQNLI